MLNPQKQSLDFLGDFSDFFCGCTRIFLSEPSQFGQRANNQLLAVFRWKLLTGSLRPPPSPEGAVRPFDPPPIGSPLRDLRSSNNGSDRIRILRPPAAPPAAGAVQGWRPTKCPIGIGRNGAKKIFDLSSQPSHSLLTRLATSEASDKLSTADSSARMTYFRSTGVGRTDFVLKRSGSVVEFF